MPKTYSDYEYRRWGIDPGRDLPVSEFCKKYGWSTRKMNAWMGEHGLHYKRESGGCWIPDQDLEAHGYVVMENNDYYGYCGTIHFSCKNYWTPKGQALIARMLAKEGILPLSVAKAATAASGMPGSTKIQGTPIKTRGGIADRKCVSTL